MRLIFGLVLLTLYLPILAQGDKKSDDKVLSSNKTEIYGARTTFQFNEQNILNNDTNFSNIDTSDHLIHRYTFNTRHDYLYQTLGRFGTPIKPIFYQAPADIGEYLGLNRLHYFLTEAEDVSYYNTYSPFTRIIFSDGGDKRTQILGTFSRNINKRWNLGIEFDRIVSRRMLGDRRVGDERAAALQRLLFFMSHISDNQRYKLLANASYSDMRQAETGGLVLDTLNQLENREEFFKLGIGSFRNRFEGVNSRKSKNWAYLYHEYNFDAALSFFHRLSFKAERYIYEDLAYSEHKEIYDSTLTNFYDSIFSRLPTYVFADTVKFRTLSNTRGFKGRIGRFSYLLGVEDRRYEYALKFVDTDSAGLMRDSTISIPKQFFYEGALAYRAKDMRLKLNAKLNNSDLYQLKFALKMPFIDLKAKKISFQPSLFQTAYRGNFISVNQRDSLANTQVIEFDAHLKFNLFDKRLYIEPFFKYQNIQNIVYWDSLSQVRQFSEPIETTQIGFKIDWTTKFLRQGVQFRFIQQNNDSILRQPTQWVNYYIYFYKNFKKAVNLKIGFDIHWHNQYFSDAYDPRIQQFRLQDRSNVGGYLQSEAFAILGLKKTSLFFRTSNLLKEVFREGYFETLGYMGQDRRWLTLGFKWHFYD